MWETDVEDVGNAVGKQIKGKQESRKVGQQEVGKQEHRKVGKQDSRILGKYDSWRVGMWKVGKEVKVEKSGNQGSRKYEV